MNVIPKKISECFSKTNLMNLPNKEVHSSHKFCYLHIHITFLPPKILYDSLDNNELTAMKNDLQASSNTTKKILLASKLSNAFSVSLLKYMPSSPSFQF